MPTKLTIYHSLTRVPMCKRALTPQFLLLSYIFTSLMQDGIRHSSATLSVRVVQYSVVIVLPPILLMNDQIFSLRHAVETSAARHTEALCGLFATMTKTMICPTTAKIPWLS